MLRTSGLLLCAVSCAVARPLPSASSVLERYVRETGGHAAWASKLAETDQVEGRSPDGAHVVLQATVSMSKDGNALTKISVPQQGEEGVYGNIAWAVTKLSGARIKHDADRDEAIRSARMLEEARWREFYPRSRVEGIETIDGHRCYRLALLPSADRRVEWFDITTGLLVRKSWTASAAYTFTVESWRTQDGLKQPSSWQASRDLLHYTLRIVSVRYNGRESFVPPAAVERASMAGALPNAEELIERHIFESGGAEAFQQIKTQRLVGTVEVMGRNLAGPTETLAAAGGRFYQTVDMPGLGKTEQGSDGAVAWERSPALGPHARPRSNLKGLGLTVDAAEVVGWRYLVNTVETEAQETLDGHDCYRVLLRSGKSAGDATHWYDRKTGLLYRTATSVRTAMGSVPAVLTYLEYRDVAGVKWPVRIHMTAGGEELMFMTSNVELNGPIDDAAFSLPEEIRALSCREAVCAAP